MVAGGPCGPCLHEAENGFQQGFIFLMLGGLQLKATIFNVNIEARDFIL